MADRERYRYGYGEDYPGSGAGYPFSRRGSVTEHRDQEEERADQLDVEQDLGPDTEAREETAAIPPVSEAEDQQEGGPREQAAPDDVTIRIDRSVAEQARQMVRERLTQQERERQEAAGHAEGPPQSVMDRADEPPDAPRYQQGAASIFEPERPAAGADPGAGVVDAEVVEAEEAEQADDAAVRQQDAPAEQHADEEQAEPAAGEPSEAAAEAGAVQEEAEVAGTGWEVIDQQAAQRALDQEEAAAPAAAEAPAPAAATGSDAAVGAAAPAPAPQAPAPPQPEAQRVTLLSALDPGAIRSRFLDIQANFVDEPRQAVEQAEQFVDELVQQVTQALEAERAKLRQGHDGDSTEELRLALRAYRAFVDRLTSLTL